MNRGKTMRVLEPGSLLKVSFSLAGILTVVTPLCGYLFGCGCAWPWAGLAEHCNYFDPRENDPCPFCAHLTLSVPLLSTLAAVSLIVTQKGIFRKQNSLILDALGGVIVFTLLTSIGASLF